jgi:hypothetical protein
MIRIVKIDPPFHSLSCRVAMSGGHSGLEKIPFFRAFATGLPSGLDGLICTSDLQDVPCGGEPDFASRMLGEVVAEELLLLAQMGEIPPANRQGVILVGDLYAFPEAAERGGKGYVRPVWTAFRERFRWVAGVAGNHDLFGDGNTELDALKGEREVFYLDGNSWRMDGLQVAGIGGIIGRPTKPFRRTEPDYLHALVQLIGAKRDVLVLHEAPEGPAAGLIGLGSVSAALEKGPAGLVICGHKEWAYPLCELANTTQILNVNLQVVLLLACA